MNRSRYVTISVLMVALSSAFVTASTLTDTQQILSNAYNKAFVQAAKNGNIIKNLDQYIQSWKEAVSVANRFVLDNASGDQDLTAPWSTIMNAHNTILTTLEDWNKIYRNNRIEAVIAKQNAQAVQNAVNQIDQEWYKVKKTMFVRTNKRAAAKLVMEFANIAARIGTKVAKDLLELKPGAPNRNPGNPTR